jgi:AraC-like DNA-binding protein
LIRVFAKEVGLSPHAYQLQVRVHRARSFILDGVPLADVAARTGFADLSHLSRNFKRFFGVSPGRYSRNH